MKKETKTFKVDKYTITIHRGPEESKEIELKRMARYVNCLFNMVIKLMAKHFEEHCPELQSEVCNILKRLKVKY